jgi:hypothetical protein
MNTRLKTLCACGLLIFCGRVSRAQMSASGRADTLPGILGPGLSVYPVTGEPYSATTESEKYQTLADGTHVDQRISATRTYRDSQGRTRMEHYLLPFSGPSAESGSLIFVHMSDPVARVRFTLNPRDHTAVESVMPAPPPPRQKRDERKPSPSPRVGPTRAFENLGTQVMEGLTVEGQRETETIPTGAEGNDAPIAVVTDRWFSQELQLLILVKRSDPRSGEAIERVTNLDRSEPDVSLFQVPPDYTITQAAGNVVPNTIQ